MTVEDLSRTLGIILLLRQVDITLLIREGGYLLFKKKLVMNLISMSNNFQLEDRL